MEIREYTKFNEEEIESLYASVGWTAYTEDMSALERGYCGSLLVLAAYEGKELLGIIRAVGDWATFVLIHDILVYPERQRQGVGTALMKAVLDRYSGVRQLQLLTDDTPKTAAFYRSLGFAELSEMGCLGFMRV